MFECQPLALADRRALADAITRGDSADDILDMDELEFWPVTYAWLKDRLEILGRNDSTDAIEEA